MDYELQTRLDSKFPPHYRIYKIFTKNRVLFEPFGKVYNHKEGLILFTNHETPQLMTLLNEYGSEKNPLFSQ